MALTPGTRLGVFTLTQEIGRGGMGEVYRARDTKLDRDVAIKVLPEAFAHDAERLARFVREAKTLASLNHPNIAAIYGLEESDGIRALVMELVEGPTLAERIAAPRPRDAAPDATPAGLPIDDALAIAKQIADALEAAHEQGIIHRDLKPANIKVRSDGTVKVLDFGLAKAMEPAGAMAANMSQFPTITSPALMTGAGMILGTAAYMSPEQARGSEVDKRADLWAFGVVLWEMLTGTRLFEGATVSDTLAAVLRTEPPWSVLAPETPPAIRRLLRRCLDKDRKRRLADASDARLEIEEAIGSLSAVEAAVAATSPSAAPRGRLAWSIAIGTGLVAAALVLPAVRYLRQTPPPEVRLDVTTPPAADPLSFAVSPDGTRLVFSASNEGRSQLWVRPLDSPAAQPLAGTEGASYPFWSPDSASVGFFADGKLKRIDLAGGAPQVLANAPLGRGGTWNAEGVIVFTPAGAGPLFTLPATGGDPVAVTRLESGQASGHRFPQFLPDGRHFIYLVGQGAPGSGVHVGSLDDVSSKRLTTADAAAVVSPSGFLVFLRQTTLFAQSFDFRAQELSGSPFPVADQVAFDSATGSPGFSAASGTVAYRTGSFSSRQLTWLDRSGKTVGLVGGPDTAGLYNVELSPDGKRVAAQRSAGGNTDVWVVDTARGVPTRFTFDAAGDGWHVWSPDGSRIVFDSNRNGGIYNLYEKLASGAGTDELLLSTDQTKGANDWSADGRLLLFRSLAQTTGWDLWVLPMSGERKPLPFLTTSFEEREGQFSPDGKWIAYQSNESGRPEIYVQPFPGPGGKFQISTDGGAQVRWNRNGRELFYVSLDSRMMAAPVTLSPDGQSLETGTAVALFPVRIAGGPTPGPYKQQYAVSSDGQRFLVNLEAEGAASPITLILNWKPDLEE